MIFALAALAFVSSNPCFDFCEQFDNDQYATACKAGCQFTDRQARVARKNDAREKVVAQLLDYYCKSKVPSHWPECYGTLGDFTRGSHDCYCDTWEKQYLNTSQYCMIGCKFLQRQWEIEPWTMD